MSDELKIEYVTPFSSYITMSKKEAYKMFGKEFVENQLNKPTMSTQQNTSNDRVDSVVDFYKKWCKENNLNGGILIGSSIKDLLIAVTEWQAQQPPQPISVDELEKKAIKFAEPKKGEDTDVFITQALQTGFYSGYKAAIQSSTDRRFTIEDIGDSFDAGFIYAESLCNDFNLPDNKEEYLNQLSKK